MGRQLRGANSVSKTRRHTRDLDQIYDDLHKKNHLQKYKDTKVKEDLPGFGEWYCTECSKWFESETNFSKHNRGKPHKRRVKALKEEPHSQKDAEAAIGLTTDNGKRSTAKDEEMIDDEIAT